MPDKKAEAVAPASPQPGEFNPAPHFPPPEGASAPEGKKSEARRQVIYRGPNDVFEAEQGGERYVMARHDVVELPESLLDWLRQRHPEHLLEEVKG